MTRKKACNSTFESAVMKNVAYLYAKIYIVIIHRQSVLCYYHLLLAATTAG